MATKEISEEHKQRMAQGRRQTKVVERYLRSLERVKAQKKRSATPEEIERKLGEIQSALVSAQGIERLELLQQREDFQRTALEAEPENHAELEHQFIAVAKSFGDRKGVSYSTWREFGVPKTVLDAAGVERTRRPHR